MLAHEHTITHLRDICNPLSGCNLRQSAEMPKLPLKNILAKNLKALRAGHATLNTYKKVGDASGLGHGTVERIEKMQSDAKIDSVEALARTFNVDPAVMLSPDFHSQIDLEFNQVVIPQYTETGGGMGGGVLLRDQPGEIQNWRVTPEWLTKNVRQHTGAGNLRIVTGFGDSMRPLFNPGDPLLVDAGVKTVEFDSIYFFRIGEEGFIKRLQRVPGQGLVAMSENKSYKEWVIQPDMDFEVFGRVLKVWCGTEF